MDNSRKYLLAGTLAIVSFPFFINGISTLLLKLDFIDDYGYTGPKYLKWLYNLFIFRDGLYDAPNIFFYLISFFLLIVILKKVLDCFFK